MKIDLKSLIIGLLAALCFAGQQSQPRYQLGPMANGAWILDQDTNKIYVIAQDTPFRPFKVSETLDLNDIIPRK